jgi:hypothetical protein
MAGIHFSFDNFEQLLTLNMGIADRLDENRAESFTLLYCRFDNVNSNEIAKSLVEILRNSDSIVHDGDDYFFVLPYTDKYGAEIVKNMFDEFFGRYLNSVFLSYPVDGDTAKELLLTLQDNVDYYFKYNLECLDSILK